MRFVLIASPAKHIASSRDDIGFIDDMSSFGTCAQFEKHFVYKVFIYSLLE